MFSPRFLCLRRSPLIGRLAHEPTTSRSYSKLLVFEICRILWRLGCDVRTYDPTGLPVKDDVQHAHPKVQELRDLSRWSDGHFWVSPEQHGNLVLIPSPLFPKFLRPINSND